MVQGFTHSSRHVEPLFSLHKVSLTSPLTGSQNYSQDCIATKTCQQSIAKVTSDSKDVYVYGLATVGTTYMLNVDDNGIINQKDNQNG